MENVELVIKIPKKEFGIEIEDKFKDFFLRLKSEIKAHLTNGTTLVCGAYELETIDMFLNAFENATPQSNPEDIAKAFQMGLAIGFGERYDEMDKVIDEIKKVITPQPSIGYWREVDTNEYACSNCNRTFSIVPEDNSIEEYKYCPNCFAKMIKHKE